MWVKILLMKQGLFIIKIKKLQKGFMALQQKRDLKELKEEGIEAEIIPWIKDNTN